MVVIGEFRGGRPWGMSRSNGKRIVTKPGSAQKTPVSFVDAVVEDLALLDSDQVVTGGVCTGTMVWWKGCQVRRLLEFHDRSSFVRLQ